MQEVQLVFMIEHVLQGDAQLLHTLPSTTKGDGHVFTQVWFC